MPSLLMANEWYLRPNAQIRPEYDTNLLLRPNDNQSAYGFQATTSATGGVRSDLYNLGLSAQFDLYRYWGQNDLDRNNWNIGFNSDYSLTELNKVGLDVDYISDTSITSELLTSGNLSGTLYGNSQVGRQNLVISPSWKYQLSLTGLLQGNYRHESNDYDQSAVNNLVNYTTDSIELGFNEQWNETTNYNLAFNALRYAYANTETYNYSLTMNIDHKYSETLSFNFMLGGRRTDTDASVSQIVGFNPSSGLIYSTTQHSQTAYGPLFGAGFIKQFEYGTVTLNYSRNTSASGIGLFLVTDAISFDSSFNLNEHLKLKLSGTALSSTNSNTRTTYERTYYAVEPKLVFELNKNISLVGGYRYRTQDFGAVDTNSDSNSVFVYFDYHFDELTNNRL